MIPRSRALVLALPVLAVAAAAPTPAGAASVAYVQGTEVWQSSVDGTQKRRLSAGEGDWRSVAAADGGRIVGIRLEAGKISQLSRFRVWGPTGATFTEGPLPYESGWSTYAMPVGLDLTADGANMIYGYSVVRGFVPNATFETGFYGTSTQNVGGLQPIKQSGHTWPTVVGTRVVGANGQAVDLQTADGPFTPTFAPWLSIGSVDVGGVTGQVQRTDVAADGRTVAVELSGGSAAGKIAVVSTAGLGGATTGATDCFLPASGKAQNVSLSADGGVVAWQDADGVKVAGRPSGTADTCALASPPVLLAPGGSFPSISGVDLPSAAPAGGGGPGDAGAGGGAGAGAGGAGAGAGGGAGGAGGGDAGSGGSGGGTTPRLTVKLPAKVTAKALVKGVALTVTVPKAGRVTATGKVPGTELGRRSRAGVTAATGSATAKRAGRVTVRLTLTKAARKRSARLRGATLTLRLAQGRTATTAKVKLR